VEHYKSGGGKFFTTANRGANHLHNTLGLEVASHFLSKQILQLVEASTVVSDGNGNLQVFISEILPLFCNVVVDSFVSFFLTERMVEEENW
jgi:hypothetical protein